VALIRSDPTRTLRISHLAEEAGMSLSAFHAHFRAVTATTPLQFQKRLRLMEAQARLQAGSSVTEAAFAVGYQSSTQFSREYLRTFGVQPRSERTRLAAE
jgi:AraC-like DNA-binding protein